MPWIRRLSSNAYVLVSLSLAATLMVFAGLTLVNTAREAAVSASWVVQSHEVLRTLATFREAFSGIASGQRALLLTGDPAYARERDDAIAQAEAALALLNTKVADHSVQHARVHQLAGLVAERVAAARDVAQQRQRAGTFARDPGPGAQARARDAMARVLRIAADFEADEIALLERRRSVDGERQRRRSIALVASVIGFSGLLLLSYTALYLESRRRRRSERQMMEIVDNLPVTVWQMESAPDGTRHFVYVGSGAERDRGVSAQSLLHDRALVLQNIVEEDRPLVARALAAAQAQRRPLDCTYRIEIAGGIRWIHNHARGRLRPDGTMLWTGYWADITERKEMEHALRQATQAAQEASRAKSNFLATMSHEIRTPLNGVLGLLELLSLTRLDAEQRATLGVVRESGVSLLRIIDDILDFSKAEAGHLELQPQPASLRDTISRASRVHSGVASSRGLLLEHTVDPHIAPVLVFDPLRLGQILNNFISNGLKFTKHGSVRIAAELLERTEAGERIRVTVTDTGIGVAPEAAGRLFQPFVQADSATWSEYGGTGLGLAISRRLAAAMGGEIRMQSTPSVGTRMSLEVTLPIGEGEPERTDHETAQRQLTHAVAGRRFAPEPAQAEAEGTLVLVVDDHPTNRMVLSRQVAALGYGALTAEDGDQALALWRERRVAAVLTDCNMPRRDGYELAVAIREEEARRGLPRMPILGCTASALSTEPERCARAGMDGCLVKPVDLIELMGTLDRWLPLPSTLPPPSGPAPLEAAERASAPYDAALLARISGGDAATESRLLADFRRAQAQDLAAATKAAAMRDFAEVRRLAHRMVGAAQSLGAHALVLACRALEDAARSEDGPTLDVDLAELAHESQRLEAALRERGEQSLADGAA